MEVSELKIFLTVARKGSISRAAEELHCVQSNVTTRIKQLEERLGTLLFHRKSKGVSLTHSGHLLLDYAERIIALAKEAEEAITNPDEPKGRLSIGTMETTAAVRLPPLLVNYHRLYPQVELNLVTGPSETSLKRLLDFQVDGAFVAGEIAHADLIAEKAFEEELVLVTPPDLTSLEQINPSKILVFRAGCSYRAQLEGWLRRTGRLPYQIMEFGSIEGIMGCVAAGMGVTFLPRSVVERPQYQDNCSFHRLPKDVAEMVTWLVRRRGETPGKALQALMDLIG
ncbi:LysR substrate-binding domain-containing protein [Trichloromonas sp.]|uniref:LysR family transcriptional regulator n=1 Tax=Trichloromonas sp. TaxID=3069249 RepID=UPI003D81A4F6